MLRAFDSVHARGASLESHYEQKLYATLRNIWRHKLLVVGAAVAALALGVSLTFLMPEQYTAEAYVRGGFTAQEAVASDGKSGAVIALDASLLTETRARLIESQQLAYRIVKRLGLERVGPAIGENALFAWLRSTFYGDATRAPGYREDMAAKKLLRGLSVKTEPRVYLITVRYTAGDPELAALIANAFLAEFLRATALQALSHERNLAESDLAERLATLGEKHPKVIKARVRLEAADAMLREHLSKTTEEIERTADASVTFAKAVTVPSSPNPPILIGVALVLGIAGGIALAAFRD